MAVNLGSKVAGVGKQAAPLLLLLHLTVATTWSKFYPKLEPLLILRYPFSEAIPYYPILGLLSRKFTRRKSEPLAG